MPPSKKLLEGVTCLPVLWCVVGCSLFYLLGEMGWGKLQVEVLTTNLKSP